MIKVYGMHAGKNQAGDATRLLIIQEGEGGKELEKLFHACHYANCTVPEFETAVKLLQEGQPLDQILALVKAR